jgi:zinc transport system ATP-binding protein
MNGEPDAMPAIVFDNVSVLLGDVSVLDGVCASVPRGASTAIVGPNGAGKTTLILALLGQLPFEGRIRVNVGVPPGTERIGYVPQRFGFDRGLPLTVLEFLAMGTQRRPLWLGLKPAARTKALELLVSVKADHLSNRVLGDLSGGELQRVLLALALEQEPDILVLDEPGAGVDIRGEQLFCEILESLRSARGFTQVIVSHDLGFVTAHATHVICLNRRVVGEGTPREVLTPSVLMATFGLHMGMADARSIPQGHLHGLSGTCEGHDHD